MLPSRLLRLLARIDGCTPVPFDLTSRDGVHSKLLAVLVFGGTCLRAYLHLFATAVFAAEVPRCAALIAIGPPALARLASSLGNLWQVLPFACVLGLANSRWHGRVWRLAALPYAAALLAVYIIEVRACRPSGPGSAVRQLVATMLGVVDVACFAGVLARLGLLLAHDPPRAEPGASAWRRWTRAELPVHTGATLTEAAGAQAARAPAAAELPAPTEGEGGGRGQESGQTDGECPVQEERDLLPVRLWVGVALSGTCVLLLFCAQLYAALLLQRDALRTVQHAKGVLHRAHALLEQLPPAASASEPAAWLQALLRYAQRLVDAAAEPAARAAAPSLTIGALGALSNEVHCKAIALRRCRRLVPLLRARYAAEATHDATAAAGSAIQHMGGEAVAGGVPVGGEVVGAVLLSAETKKETGAEKDIETDPPPRALDLAPFSAYWAFYLIPTQAANSIVAFAALSAALSLLVFSLLCAPVRVRLWTSWLSIGYVSALGVDYCLRLCLFQGLLGTREGPRLPRLFRAADLLFSFTLGPVAGTSSVLLRAVLASLVALAGFARIDVPLLPRTLAAWDPLFAAWQAMLKLHCRPPRLGQGGVGWQPATAVVVVAQGPARPGPPDLLPPLREPLLPTVRPHLRAPQRTPPSHSALLDVSRDG
ncbi:hypothetical protein T492DRAFT_1044604 [Pavlovales sp. CCMP2436]|nr:hypothetical protein T492DRAFT_1044604 [Pavlovales sp. CCMP2436]